MRSFPKSKLRNFYFTKVENVIPNVQKSKLRNLILSQEKIILRIILRKFNLI